MASKRCFVENVNLLGYRNYLLLITDMLNSIVIIVFTCFSFLAYVMYMCSYTLHSLYNYTII